MKHKILCFLANLHRKEVTHNRKLNKGIRIPFQHHRPHPAGIAALAGNARAGPAHRRRALSRTRRSPRDLTQLRSAAPGIPRKILSVIKPSFFWISYSCFSIFFQAIKTQDYFSGTPPHENFRAAVFFVHSFHSFLHMWWRGAGGRHNF